MLSANSFGGFLGYPHGNVPLTYKSRPCVGSKLASDPPAYPHDREPPRSRDIRTRQYKNKGRPPFIYLPSSTFCLGRAFLSLRPPSAYRDNLQQPTATQSLPTMAPIDGRNLLYRAANVVRGHYNRCLKLLHARSTPPGPSSSLIHPKSLSKTAPVPQKACARVTVDGQAPKGRKQGRIKQKGYNELAKDNSTVFVPGGFRKDPVVKKPPRRSVSHNPRRTYRPKNRASEAPRQAQTDNDKAANERDFIMKQLESLIFDKLNREDQFEAKEMSERVKEQAPERKTRMDRETKEAERLWKMAELERREEKERADRWKDQRLAQLEKEKKAAESQLVREKAERKQSKLQRVFKDQQRRHRVEEFWKQLREKDEKNAADREANLLRENAMLVDGLRLKDTAFQRACNERDYMMEGERRRELGAFAQRRASTDGRS